MQPLMRFVYGSKFCAISAQLISSPFLISIMFQKYYQKIEELKKTDHYRTLVKVTGSVDAEVSIDGKKMILLSSNNYLGLAGCSAMKKRTIAAVQAIGTGAGASRLISGNLEIHEELEKRIAKFKSCDSAILFSTGYMANLGVISSLAGKGDLILSDHLNHASIIDGCRLSGAEIIKYPHKDFDYLDNFLSRRRSDLQFTGKILIITDGLFSMDGDLAPLPQLQKIAKKNNGLLLVDDAHATGVIGSSGKGTCEHFGLEKENVIQIGTFSKALGSLGGFVTGPEIIIEYLKNTARSFIYTTALPPSVCASSLAALDIIENDPSIRKNLMGNVETVRSGLIDMGYNCLDSKTHIIPVVTGEAGVTMKFARGLLEKGIFAPAIRPPTVPDGKSRIRVSLMSSHTEKHLEIIIDGFRSEGRRLGII